MKQAYLGADQTYLSKAKFLTEEENGTSVKPALMDPGTESGNVTDFL